MSDGDEDDDSVENMPLISDFTIPLDAEFDIMVELHQHGKLTQAAAIATKKLLSMG